jgi:hypothetical protein
VQHLLTNQSALQLAAANTGTASTDTTGDAYVCYSSISSSSSRRGSEQLQLTLLLLLYSLHSKAEHSNNTVYTSSRRDAATRARTLERCDTTAVTRRTVLSFEICVHVAFT